MGGVTIKVYKGRSAIYTNEVSVTRDNIIDILKDSMSKHNINSGEIEYLYQYYKGRQDIQEKTKETRPDINNIITENRAYEIVTFKKGYVFGEPVQYIPRGERKDNDETISNGINDLNDHMIECDKGELDSELAEWLFIGGVAYRMVLPNEEWEEDNEETPFKMYSLDPRKTFVVRFNNLDKTVAMGVTYIKDDEGGITWEAYTKDMHYVVNKTEGIVLSEPHFLGRVPIIEYVHNNARLGVFEPVLPLLNAINSVQSNRLDDIEQTVNAFLGIFGAELDEETYKKIQEWKTLVLPEGSNAKYMNAPLQQNDIQVFVEDLYHTILTICGMPKTENGGGGDNGVAVHLRTGWSQAECQAKSVEKTFKKSERETLKIILRILDGMGGTVLKLKNIDIKFARRYSDNILTKVQALTQLLDCGIKPEIAIATCGIWNDPTDVAIQSKSYLSKWELEDEEEGEDDVLQAHGQEAEETENIIEENL